MPIMPKWWRDLPAFVQALPWVTLILIVFISIAKMIPDSVVQARTINTYEKGQFDFSYDRDKAELRLLQNGEWKSFAGDSIVMVQTPNQASAQVQIKGLHVTNAVLGDTDPRCQFAIVTMHADVSRDSRLVFPCKKGSAAGIRL